MGLTEAFNDVVNKRAAQDFAYLQNVTTTTLQDPDIRDEQITQQDIQKLPRFKEMLKTEKRLDTYVNIYKGTQLIGTLTDLERIICKEFGITSFKELGIGRLIKYPPVSSLFKVPKNVFSTPSIEVEDVYSHYNQYLSDASKEINRKNLESEFNIKSKYSQKAFEDYMKNIYKKEFARLGILIQSFESFHNQLSKAFLAHKSKVDNFTANAAKEYKNDFTKLVRDSEFASKTPWIEVIEFIHAEHGEAIWELGDEFKPFLRKWDLVASERKPFNILTLSISSKHSMEDNGLIIKLAAYCILLEYKCPSEMVVVNDCLAPHNKDELDAIKKWTGHIKRSHWNFSDLHRYMLNFYFNQMVTRNSTHFLCLYLLAGRAITATHYQKISLDTDFLDSIKPPQDINHKNTKTVFIDAFKSLSKDEDKITLIQFQKTISDIFSGSTSYLYDGLYHDFLESVHTFIPEIDLTIRINEGDIPEQSKNSCVINPLNELMIKPSTCSSPLEFLNSLHEIENQYFPNNSSHHLAKQLILKGDEFLNEKFKLTFTSPTLINQPCLVPIEDVFSFLNELRNKFDYNLQNLLREQYHKIEWALRQHFLLDRVSDLGHGSLDDILSRIEENDSSSNDSIEKAILISLPSLDLKQISYLDESCILERIMNCALLCDLETRVGWKFVKSDYPSFDSFIQSNLNYINKKLQQKNLTLFQMTHLKYTIIPLTVTNDDFEVYINENNLLYAIGVLISTIVKLRRPPSQFRYFLKEFIKKLSMKQKPMGVDMFYKELVQTMNLLPGMLQASLMHTVFKVVFDEFDRDSMKKMLTLKSKKEEIPEFVYFLGLRDLVSFESETNSQNPSQNFLSSVPQGSIFTFHQDDIIMQDAIKDLSTKNTYLQTSNQNASMILSTPIQLKEKECRLFVDQLRKTEFGLDDQISYDPRQSQLNKTQTDRLNRALKKLANELYSEDSHFVLELLQNADDNSYLPEVVPSITFKISKSSIIVLNNEIGFNTNNIKSICDIAASTKEGTNDTYIGQKGIGFKSVFRISDQPEIHSNNFHIKFDSESYIIPKWIIAILEPSDLTVINLPYRDEIKQRGSEYIMRKVQLSILLNKFQDLEPMVLLFLRRIREIKIVNQVDSRTFLIQKRKTSKDEIELLSDSKVTKWKTFESLFQLNIIVQGKRLLRPSTLRLAMNIDYINNQDIDLQNYEPSVQQTFAFLPLRSYGFKFVIHGDFFVPSSREDVDHDSPWNEQLREKIPHFILAFFEYMKNDWITNYPKDQWSSHLSVFLKHIPAEHDLTGFFDPVALLTMEVFQNSECILCEDYTWAKPSQTIQYPNKQSAHDLPYESLNHALNLKLVHEDLYLTKKLRKSLKIPMFGPSHLITLLKQLSPTDPTHSVLIQNAIKHFIILLDSESSMEQKALISEFKLLPLFFIVGKSDVSPLANDRTYFYIDSNTLYYESCINHFEFFERLVIVDFSSYSLLKSDSSTFLRLVTLLGIKLLHEKDICNDFILSELEPGRNYGHQDILEFTVFLATFIGRLSIKSEITALINTLKTRLPLLTSLGSTYYDPQNLIHSPNNMFNDFSPSQTNNVSLWETVSNDYIDWCLSSDIKTFDPEYLIHLQDFFSLFGISKYFYILETESHPDPQYHIQDYRSPELTILFNKFNLLKSNLTLENSEEFEIVCCKIDKLCQHLSFYWESHYSQYTKSIKYKKNAGHPDSIESVNKSTFLSLLLDNHWIPTEKGNLAKSSSLYSKTPEIVDLFLDEIEYVYYKDLSTSFIKSMEFKTLIDPADMVKVFTNWIVKGGFYEFNLETLKKIYDTLNTFEDLGPFPIFVPFNSTFFNDQKSRGVFIDPSDCVWSDPNGIGKGWNLDETNQEIPDFINLSMIYPDNQFKSVFIRSGVAESPCLAHYIAALLFTEPINTNNHAEMVFRKYQLLDTISDKFSSSEYDSQILSIPNDSKFIPTHQCEWRSISEFPVINDSTSIYKQFQKFPDIHFIGFSSEKETLQLTKGAESLLKNLGIKSALSLVHSSQHALPRYAISKSQTIENFINLLVNAFWIYLDKNQSDLLPENRQITIILSHILDIEINLCGHEEIITRDHYHISPQKQGGYKIYLSEEGTKMLGNLFCALAKLFGIGSLRFLEEMRMYFFSAQALVSDMTLLNAQLKADEYFDDSVDNIEFLYHDEEDESDSDDNENKSENEFNETDGKRERIMVERHANKRIRISADLAQSEEQMRLRYESFKRMNSKDISVEVDGILNFSSLIQQKNKETGLYGEEIVFNYLKNNAPSHHQVIWNNDPEEKGDPYDILVKDRTTNGIIEYIEVKATIYRERLKFEISKNEWEYAKIHGPKFTIIRISNVRIQENATVVTCNLMTLRNPYSLHEQRILKLQFLAVLFPQFYHPDQPRR